MGIAGTYLNDGIDNKLVEYQAAVRYCSVTVALSLTVSLSCRGTVMESGPHARLGNDRS